jgi:hypothetical protein
MPGIVVGVSPDGLSKVQGQWPVVIYRYTACRAGFVRGMGIASMRGLHERRDYEFPPGRRQVRQRSIWRTGATRRLRQGSCRVLCRTGTGDTAYLALPQCLYEAASPDKANRICRGLASVRCGMRCKGPCHSADGFSSRRGQPLPALQTTRRHMGDGPGRMHTPDSGSPRQAATARPDEIRP